MSESVPVVGEGQARSDDTALSIKTHCAICGDPTHTTERHEATLTCNGCQSARLCICGHPLSAHGWRCTGTVQAGSAGRRVPAPCGCTTPTVAAGQPS